MDKIFEKISNEMLDGFQIMLEQTLRKEKITQKMLAKEIGVSRATINRWINGREIPRLDMFFKLCALFYQTPNDLCLINLVADYFHKDTIIRYKKGKRKIERENEE